MQPVSPPTSTPTAPVLPTLMPPPQGLHANPLTATTTFLLQSLLQQQIRMYIESEIARAIPTAIPSAPQQQRDDYEIA